jgi:hypothetical protein
VAASEQTDAKASYSNWGTCVEVYAPGSSIKRAAVRDGCDLDDFQRDDGRDHRQCERTPNRLLFKSTR